MKPDAFILFTSDHGEMLGDHHRFRKTYAYEGSARVPFLTHAPPSMQLPRNVVCDAPAGLQDVMPTLLDVAGMSPPGLIAGKEENLPVNIKTNAMLKAIHTYSKGAQLTPNLPNWLRATAILQENLQRVFKGEMLPRNALLDAQARMQPLVDEDLRRG